MQWMYWKAVLKQYVGIEFIVYILVMNQEQKQAFVWNVMKLIVWLVLLFISYGYLQEHPAEKDAAIAGPKIMYERWQMFVYDIIGKDVVRLKQKFSLIQYYNELIQTAQKRKCTDLVMLQELDEANKSLNSASYDDLPTLLPELSNKAQEFDRKIDATCKVE